MENKILRFKHTCFSGDLIYALAGIKALCDQEGDRAVIYQWLNQNGVAYAGAEHPYGGVMMNEYAFKMMKPLIEHQPYVSEFLEWRGEAVHIDIDQFRQIKNHMPYGNIATWPAFACPEMTPRYWESWLKLRGFELNESYDLPELPHEKIIINRTSRYQNQWISYFFLKEYQDRLLFVGTPEEHKIFCADWGMDIPYFEVANFLHLAFVIDQCKLFIGNQSMCFAIAEGLKAPRLLEVFDGCPNVQPTGENGYYFRAPEPFEYLVKKLINR